MGTADTSITVAASDDLLRVTSLKSASGHDWLSGGPNSLPLIATAEVDGKSVPLTWKLKKASVSGDSPKRVEFIFVCDTPALELHSLWQAYPGPGPVEHFLSISNRSASTVLLPLQKSLALDLRSPGGHGLEHLWVEKGGQSPTQWGTHYSKVSPGYVASLVSRPYSRDNPNDPMPWTTLVDREGRQGVYLGIEFSGLVRIALQADEASRVKTVLGLGLDDSADAAFRTRLAPGAVFEAAPVLAGCYQGDEDDGSNRLRRWVESHLRPASPYANLPILVNNSWGSGMAVDEKLSRSMIDLSSDMGMEMFHIDAGWFKGVGNWHPDPNKFPASLGPVADYTHSKGLKFGLWIGWTQGGHMREGLGSDAVLGVFDDKMKSWFTRDYDPNWKTQDFVGADVCLGDDRAVEWCLKDLRRCVGEYKLDLLEHDQRMVVENCSRTDHRHTSSPIDVAAQAARGYYQVYDTLRRENPGLLFENCVNGGHMVDFGVLRRTHYTSITDAYDPLSNRRAFHDSVYFMPPSMCECYVENHPGETSGNFVFMLRSGMMGWCTIMLDMSQWTPEQRSLGRKQFELYKQKLRPLVNAANLYHISPRPDGENWDGVEYYNPATGQGVVYAFRGKKLDDSRHAFGLKGLNPKVRYALTYEDQSSKSMLLTGKELMETGLPVVLAEAESSELIWIERK